MLDLTKNFRTFELFNKTFMSLTYNKSYNYGFKNKNCFPSTFLLIFNTNLLFDGVCFEYFGHIVKPYYNMKINR